jgi:hypothetical protein
MKLGKISAIILFGMLFMTTFIPKADAKTSFSFGLNIDARPRYYGGYTYVERRPVYPAYCPYYARPVYAPYYQEAVIVERPYAERVYVQPVYPYPY